MKKLDAREAHRRAGLCCNFMWQDEAAEGIGDPAEVDYTSILGTLPEQVNGSPVFLVHVQGTADSGFGYSYQVERDVKVWLKEDGEPIINDATDEEIEAAEQHKKDEACQEYASLQQLIDAGAYDERDHEGNDGEDGIERRIDQLNEWAIVQGLHFAPSKTEGKTIYILEPATDEEIDAYLKAQEAAEEDEE